MSAPDYPHNAIEKTQAVLVFLTKPETKFHKLSSIIRAAQADLSKAEAAIREVKLRER